jgi:osmotically-inducible protein OsmY
MTGSATRCWTRSSPGSSLDPSAFEVTVTSGIVTINGQADSYGLACQLIDTVRHVDGVIEVRDRVSYPAGDVPKTTGHNARHPA